MQTLSQKHAVFARIAVAKQPSDDERALLRKYKVTRTGCAVLADRHGNFIMKAERRNPKRLLKQIVTARKAIAKIEATLAERIEKGESALKDNNKLSATLHFRWIVKNYPGYPEAESAAQQLSALEEQKKLRAN